jgi:hypothetical protein
MPTTAQRRKLRYATINDVMPDVALLLQGHHTVGNWSLGQICNHLSSAFDGSLDGFPHGPPWFVQYTIGPLIYRLVLRSEWMPRGRGLPERFAPRPGLDALAETERLRRAIARFESHQGPVKNHPLTWKSTKDEWREFHRIHCAHHLSFAIPDGAR